MTDTALAIALLPRLHRAGIATDLRVDSVHRFWLEGGGHDYNITDSQAIAYIVGCMVLAKRRAQDDSTPTDVMMCNARTLDLIESEPA